ncbi:hypothetical protein Syun_012765 [Stephania yunnanensis]|uniref:Uncharacterized protein n=1 Tax=Stephania yunnanensis TaxID=152371 RepID=A0AAP0PJ86_9MAGN
MSNRETKMMRLAAMIVEMACHHDMLRSTRLPIRSSLMRLVSSLSSMESREFEEYTCRLGRFHDLRDELKFWGNGFCKSCESCDSNRLWCWLCLGCRRNGKVVGTEGEKGGRPEW